MRIGVLTNAISGGGAERQAAQWAAVIAKWPDATVEVLTVHDNGARYALPEGVRLTVVDKRHKGDLLRVARTIRRFVKRMDLVICFQPYPALFCIGSGVPELLVTGDDPRFHWRASGWPDWLLHLAFRNAAAASAPTPELIDCYRELGIRARGPWLCVPNIVDEAGYAATTPEHKEGVLFVGRLEEEKDPQLAIDASVAAGAPLTVLGIGSLHDELAARADGHAVELAGFAASPWEHYARSRVVLVTSRNEAFGNIIVEGLAAGTPVVSVDCDFGPRFVLKGTRFSTVVDSRDPAVLGAALRTVLDRPYGEEERDECETVAAQFRPDAVAAQIREAVERTLAVRPARWSLLRRRARPPGT